MERQHTLEHAEREDGEQDGGRCDPEAARSQCRAVRCELAPGGGLADEQDQRHGEHEQGQIGEERAVDTPEDAERRADQPAHGVGREHSAHAQVLLPGPALERVEGHADPDAAGADPHDEARREVDGKRVAEDEAERAQRNERKRSGQQRPGARAAHEPAREREASRPCRPGNEATSARSSPGRRRSHRRSRGRPGRSRCTRSRRARRARAAAGRRRWLRAPVSPLRRSRPPIGRAGGPICADAARWPS